MMQGRGRSVSEKVRQFAEIEEPCGCVTENNLRGLAAKSVRFWVRGQRRLYAFAHPCSSLGR
jgi:hypothetical protein